MSDKNSATAAVKRPVPDSDATQHASSADAPPPAKKSKNSASTSSSSNGSGEIEKTTAATAVTVFQPPDRIVKGSHVPSRTLYNQLYKQSIKDPEKFWENMAKENLIWSQPFDAVRFGSLEKGNVAWFINGRMNACVNCVDRHVLSRGDKVAIIWESDEPGASKKITYKELLDNVCRVANALKSKGVRRGDAVTIYMPMIPEIAYTMLACARIGAPHSVVFAGFSAQALASRVHNCSTKWIVTADEGKRGGRTLGLKKIVDDAIGMLPDETLVRNVFVFSRTGSDQVPYVDGRDVKMSDLLPLQRPFCPAEQMDAEDTLFLLYTSGSTGAPKGVAHTTAGYMLWTSTTHRYVFDLREDDVFACVADCGWITGHSYIVYGPLCNGATTVIFESTPLYPDAGRYWDMCQRHKVTQFYTAPTAIRALAAKGDAFVQKYDLSNLRVLGTVGEPINPEAWLWYHKIVGKEQCAVVDTYWQTETGGHIVTPLPGAIATKPGSATLPFFGIELAVLDAKTGKELEGNNVEGVLCVKQPWPGMARTVFGDHQRYMDVYLRPYKGMYFTGDGCRRDGDGYYWITGRVDDVLNISGHRIGTAEIESALALHDAVAEAAVVGFAHDIKGQGMACYCVRGGGGGDDEEQLRKALTQQVRSEIGPFAKPDKVLFVPGLPKTRSGKVMRRLLRKVISGVFDVEKLGDVSTLKDPSVVRKIIDVVRSA